MWPSHNYCVLTYIDLSAAHNSETFSFSGSSTHKSQATVVSFHTWNSSSIDFIPKEITKDFANLNGLIFDGYDSPVLKDKLFISDFRKIEYLDLSSNKIHTIEESALEHLFKLKWINFFGNKIQSLPFKIFENNPELMYVNFALNEIASIHPNLFDGLNKLKIVYISINRCIDKDFGCETCLVSQSALKTGLNSCFSICLSDQFCFNQIIQSAATHITRTVKKVRAEFIELTSTIDFDNTRTIINKVGKMSLKFKKINQEVWQNVGNVLKATF